jgi:hypothetical protein
LAGVKSCSATPMLTTVTPTCATSSLEVWLWPGRSFPLVPGETLCLACRTGQRRRSSVLPFMEALPRLRGASPARLGGDESLVFATAKVLVFRAQCTPLPTLYSQPSRVWLGRAICLLCSSIF